MGLSAQEFWALAPVQYYAMLERHRIHEEWQDYRAAQIVACLSNIYRDRKKRSKPFTEWDFMPGRKPKPSHQSPDQILTAFQMIAASLRGRKKGNPDGG